MTVDDPAAVLADLARVKVIFQLRAISTAMGLGECGCIPGHRSTHLTHACVDCGLLDSDVADGQPIPPCKGREA